MNDSTTRRTQRTHKKHIEIQENPEHPCELGKIKHCPNCGSLLKVIDAQNVARSTRIYKKF